MEKMSEDVDGDGWVTELWGKSIPGEMSYRSPESWFSSNAFF